MTYASPAMDFRTTKTGRNPSVLTVGGAALALGAFGVAVTSVLYALSPPAAALPAYPLDQALAGAIAGARTLFAAGTVGIFSDIVMAVGSVPGRTRTGSAGTCGRGGRLDCDAPEHRGLYVCRCDRRLCARAARRNERRRRRLCRIQAPVRRALPAGDGRVRRRRCRGAGRGNARDGADRPSVACRDRNAGGTRQVRSPPQACFIGLPFGQGVGICIGLGSVLFVAVGAQLVLMPQ